MNIEKENTIVSKEIFLQGFIKALEEEIDAAQRGKGGSVIKVTNGKFLRQEANIFIYSFQLESFLYTVDDAPIELMVGSVRYTGQIVQNQDQEVIIGIESNLGNAIPEAKIVNKLSFLLENLKKKLKEAYDTGEYLKFDLANFIFEGKIVDIVKDIPIPKAEESSKENNLNPSQIEAVRVANGLPLSLVFSNHASR